MGSGSARVVEGDGAGTAGGRRIPRRAARRTRRSVGSMTSEEGGHESQSRGKRRECTRDEEQPNPAIARVSRLSARTSHAMSPQSSNAAIC